MSDKHPTPWFVQGSIGTPEKQVRDASGTPVDFTDFEIAGRVVHAVNVEARLMAGAKVQTSLSKERLIQLIGNFITANTSAERMNDDDYCMFDNDTINAEELAQAILDAK